MRCCRPLRAAVPATADAVVVGGGCVGAAVAHRLAGALGPGKSVVLLERESGLAQATSSWAAGLVGQVRRNPNRVRLAMESVRMFSQMQREHDESGGDVPGPTWCQTGSLRVAYTQERVEEFKLMLDACKEAGLEAVLESPERSQERWPAANFPKVGAIACLWCPTDGYLQPADLAASYRYRAAKLGARVVCGAMVQEIRTTTATPGSRRRVAQVCTTKGDVEAPLVINAAGTHATTVAERAGCRRMPIVPVRHCSYVTSAMPGVQASHPVLRISDRFTYIRADCDRLLVGGFEPEPLSKHPDDFPPAENPAQPDVSWDALAAFGEAAAELFGPRAAEVSSVQQGWPTFAPDANFVIGESPDVEGFVYAGGCLAHGVSGSAGIAKAVVESVTVPFEEQSEYVRAQSPKRFVGTDWTDAAAWQSAEKKCRDIYATYYKVSL
eukprot:TRINITY_DN6458_c0_g1_i1.p1 TRINITY_DN6458_c0_g1~~TRINITY_DN6458_c0_g1_i1.p1  ORF type:complete len:440 (+),score=93.33 TRINITY_DN6458_c0_g1_i1:70-1389(+)